MRLIIITLAISNLICLGTKAQHEPHYHEGRNTIVHLFEWKWIDIAEECERFLGPRGFAGVQVSPVNENLIVRIEGNVRPWYERYQPLSYHLVTRSGNEPQFIDMVNRCNKVGVRIYVDVVFNHMTGNADGKAVGTGGNSAEPDKRNYPAVPFTSNNFHPQCQIHNYQSENEVRNCELVGLHDLNQADLHVQKQVVSFLNHLIQLGVAGFRVDAAKHMWPKDLEQIYAQVQDLNISYGFKPKSRPFIYQEVIDLGGEAVATSQYSSFGVVTEFKFGATLGKYFRGHDKLAHLHNWGQSWGMLNSSDALVFIDNHDNQRGHGAGGLSILTYKVPKNYKMAVAFMMAHPYGVTRLMSSFAFTDPSIGPPTNEHEEITTPQMNALGECVNGWVCEHRWRQIYNMVAFRQQVKDQPLTNWWDNGDNQIAFGRGDQGFVAFTLRGHLKQNLQTQLPPGKYCDVISGAVINGKCTGKTITITDQKVAAIEIFENDYDGVIAIHRGAMVQ